MIMKLNVMNDVSKDSPYKAYTFQSEIDTSPSRSALRACPFVLERMQCSDWLLFPK